MWNPKPETVFHWWPPILNFIDPSLVSDFKASKCVLLSEAMLAYLLNILETCIKYSEDVMQQDLKKFVIFDGLLYPDRFLGVSVFGLDCQTYNKSAQ